jgi:hypothetical protein
MAQGGSRKHAADCKCGNCPKMGRPKAVRATNANVAQKVLNEAKAEQLWLSLIDLERRRLGINKTGELSMAEKGAITGPDYQGRFSIIPLTNLLRYLEDRAYGHPINTVNHLHDKPIEVNATLSLGEGMRLAMQKADERLRNHKR